jgi:predicted MFS family arabinose efflux permease
VRQERSVNPLVPLRMFRSRNVTGANVVQMLMVAGLFGMFFLGVLYLQGIVGYDAIETGLAFLPVSVLIGVLSLGLSPRLNERFGARAVLLVGLVLLAAALGLFARAPLDPGYVIDLLPTMVLFGIGAGLAFPALMTLAMSGATPSDSGLASGLVNTSLQVGGAVGLAVLASLSATRTDTLLAEGESTAEALVGGYRFSFVVAAGIVVAAIGVATTVLRSERRAAAEAAARAEQVPGDPAYSEAA